MVARYTTGERRFKERLLGWADLRPLERVVDLGCGTGTLLVAAGGQEPGPELIGVDRDLAVLRRARRKVQAAAVGVELCLVDARSLPMADGSVDVVVSSLFFHHLLSDAKSLVLAEISRVLGIGGRLAVADWGAPRGGASRVGAGVVRRFDGDEPTRDNLDGRLAELIETAGFDDVIVRARLGVPLGVIEIITATRSLDRG